MNRISAILSKAWSLARYDGTSLLAGAFPGCEHPSNCHHREDCPAQQYTIYTFFDHGQDGGDTFPETDRSSNADRGPLEGNLLRIFSSHSPPAILLGIQPVSVRRLEYLPHG